MSRVPRVESFIVRFIEDRSVSGPKEGLLNWRGVIVHIQSNRSKGFSKLADALAFMSRYVRTGDFVSEESEPPDPDQRDS
jgi:hypothetical protein